MDHKREKKSPPELGVCCRVEASDVGTLHGRRVTSTVLQSGECADRWLHRREKKFCVNAFYARKMLSPQCGRYDWIVGCSTSCVGCSRSVPSCFCHSQPGMTNVNIIRCRAFGIFGAGPGFVLQWSRATKRTLKSPNRVQLRIQTRKVLTIPNDFFLTGRSSVCVCERWRTHAVSHRRFAFCYSGAGGN